MTTAAFLDGSKTVTRRTGWKTLKPGTILMGVKKCMGFRPGEKVEYLGAIEVVSVRREPLSNVLVETNATAREGFPELSAAEFIAHFGAAMKCGPLDEVTRIEFKHLGPRNG